LTTTQDLGLDAHGASEKHQVVHQSVPVFWKKINKKKNKI